MQELTQDQQKLYDVLKPNNEAPTAEAVSDVLQLSMLTSEEIGKVVSMALEAWADDLNAELEDNNDLRDQIRGIKEKIADWWLEER